MNESYPTFGGKQPRKFIGGAERARRQARSRGWEPPSQKKRRLQKEKEQKNRQQQRRTTHTNRNSQHAAVVPLSTKKLHSRERFFASLLESSNFPERETKQRPPSSSVSGNDPRDVLDIICARLGLGPLPVVGRQTGGSNHSYLPHTDNPRRFFASRAVLVMEEARHELEEALLKNQHTRRGSRRPSKDSWSTVKLDSIDLDQKRTGSLRLGLAKASKFFSPDELKEQRPGSCFEIEAWTTPQATAAAAGTEPTRVRMLGTVAPGKPGSAKLVLVVYERACIDRVLLLLSSRTTGQEQPQHEDPQPTSSESRHSPLCGRPVAAVQWKIRFCISLISHCRQFEACDFGCVGHHKGGVLLKKIMGQKQATHIRFQYSDDDEETSGGGTNAESDDGPEEGEEEIVGYVMEETECEETVGEWDNEGDGKPGGPPNDPCAKKEQYQKQHLTLSSFKGLKALNPTQKTAANTFCSSEESRPTLELIQGPPGTGKTTFVVSVLAKLLCAAERPKDGQHKHKRRRRRILVTAPTNKAVVVLAKRFLESCPGLLDKYGIPVAMIGVEDKLLEEPTLDEGSTTTTTVVDRDLRRIFCYTWLDSLAEDYKRLLEKLASETARTACSSSNEKAATKNVGNRGLTQWLSHALPTRSDTLMVDDDSDSNTEDEQESVNYHTPAATPKDQGSGVTATAKDLHVRLVRNLPRWSKSSGASNLSQKILGFLSDGDVSAAFAYTQALIQLLTNDPQESSDIDDEDEVGYNPSPKKSDALPELLASARIIFCTLSTAGTSLMKQTSRIDDWIVDEAAAATEPELLIPLHLNPTRLLVVGDPKQLPASVSSPFSERWGLGRSLHERLTVDLGISQTMLDVQYRMKPSIAAFPSQRFYDGKLTNGENVKDKNYGLFYSSVGDKSSKGDLLKTTPPFCFFQVDGREQQSHTGSYYNTEEALAVVTLLKMVKAKSHSGRGKSQPSWCSSDKIRIITFYSAQVATLQQILRREGLKGVLVSTVDSSQGCEADLVVLSFVRTNGAGFLTDDRRMNVALTRARHKLICLGNAFAAQSSWKSRTLENLLGEVRRRGCLSQALAQERSLGANGEG